MGRPGAHDDSVISTIALPYEESTPSKLLSSGRDECVKIWDIERMSANVDPLFVMHTGGRHFCNIAMDTETSSHLQGLVASPSADEHRAYLWDVRTGSVAMEISTSKDNGAITTLHAAKGSLFIGFEDGSLSVFDVRAGDAGSVDPDPGRKPPAPQLGSAAHFEVHDKEPLMAMDMHPSNHSLVTGSADSNLGRLHFSGTGGNEGSEDTPGITAEGSSNKAGKEVKKDFTGIPTPGTSSVKFRADGRILLSGHWDGTVRLWEVKKKLNLKPVAVLAHHTQSVFAVAFKDGMFATASKDSTIAVWSIYANTLRSR